MALIKCNECGKEISDKAKVCVNCGCPIEKEIKCDECGNILNSKDKICKKCGCPISDDFKCEKKINKNNLICFVIGGTIILIILLFIIGKNNISKPNIVGTWNHLYSSSYYHYWIEYTFEENGKAKRRYITYGDEEILECDYRFRNNNTEIKISCNYDDETLKNERNVWVSFEKKENTIYIDNIRYDFGDV